MGLADEEGRPVDALAYGRQRLTELAVSLGLAPRVLLLDEPAAGVPSGESGRIIEAIESLPPEIAVLIIDHDMDLVFRLARRITVLVQGSVLAEGMPVEIAADRRVRQVYRVGVIAPHRLVLDGVSAGYGDTIVLAGIGLELAQHAVILDRGIIVFAGASRGLLAAPGWLDA